jgi:3-phenylpropionate/trans-cinnamate dioxygenase ferredoxin reductase subunit
MPEPIVIIGAGQAAAKAVETLRGAGHDRPIVLVGEESHPPYQRPPLSKKYLAGEADAEALRLKAEDFYAGSGVDLKLATRVDALDPAAHRVLLAGGATVPYSQLLIATGARPRRLPLTGASLAGVVTLRSIADVDAIRAQLAQAERIVVIGGGYIGLEVAAVACTRGHRVTVLEGQDRVLARVVAEPMSRHFEDLHRGRGVDLRNGVRIAELTGSERVSGVLLADGTLIPADLVLVAIGAEPNDELARVAGLAVDDGIVVDTSTRTSAPEIFAAGDCTRFPSRRYGRAIRLESVQNAIDQAKAAALAMLGEAQNYDPVPWFWSDQYDVKLQIAGLSQGYDRFTTEANGEASFALSYYAGDRLLAVDAVNHPRAHMLARRALAGDTTAAPARRRAGNAAT